MQIQDVIDASPALYRCCPWVSVNMNPRLPTPATNGALLRAENWRPQLPVWGAVLKVSETGQLLQWLVDLKGETVSRVSSAHEHGGRLYLGNLAGDYVSYVDVVDLPPDGAQTAEE
jgi:hypothetical protein